jgi:hypothetical protein
MTPAKASHANGHSAKNRRIRVAGSMGEFCSMPNEPEITSSAGFFRTGSSRSDGKGLIVDEIRLELRNSKYLCSKTYALKQTRLALF